MAVRSKFLPTNCSCDTVWCCDRIPTFRRTMLPSSSPWRCRQHNTTRHHSPEDLDLKVHRRESIKYCIFSSHFTPYNIYRWNNVVKLFSEDVDAWTLESSAAMTVGYARFLVHVMSRDSLAVTVQARGWSRAHFHRQLFCVVLYSVDQPAQYTCSVRPLKVVILRGMVKQ